MTRRIARTPDLEKGTYTFTDMTTNKSVSLNVDKLPKDIQRQLMFHGVNGKVGDSAASPNVDAIAVMTGVIAALVAGTWSSRSGGGGKGSTKLARAIAMALDKELSAVVTMLEGKTDDEKKALRAHADVKLALARIDEEDAKAKAKAAKAGQKDADDLGALLG